MSKRKSTTAPLPVLNGIALTVIAAICGGICGRDLSVLNGAGSVYLGTSVVVTVILAGKLHLDLTNSRLLAVTSVLPLSSGQIVRLALKSIAAVFLLPLVFCLSFAVAYAAAAGFHPAQMACAVCLGLISWLMVAGCAMALVRRAAWFDSNDQAFGCGCLMIGVVIGTVFAGELVGGAIPLVLAWGTPTGWVALVLDHAVAKGAQLYLWLLLPCAGVVILALYSLAALDSHFVFNELYLTHEGTARRISHPDSRAVEEALVSFEVDANKDAAEPVLIPAGYSIDDFDDGELPVEEAREHVIADLREPIDWSLQPFLDRLLYSMLTPAERVILNYSYDRNRDMIAETVRLYVWFAVITVVCAVGDLAFGDDGFNNIPYVLVFVMILFWTFSWPNTVWKSGDHTRCPSSVLLPVRSRDVTSYMMKCSLFQSLVLFPLGTLTALFGVVGDKGFPDPVPALVSGGKMCLILIAAYQWSFLLIQPCEVKGRSMSKGDDVFMIVPALIAAMAGIGLYAVGSNYLGCLVASSVMLAFGWLAQKLHQRRVLKQPTDFVTPVDGS